MWAVFQAHPATWGQPATLVSVFTYTTPSTAVGAAQLVSTIHTLPMPFSAPQPWVNVLPEMSSHLFSESW